MPAPARIASLLASATEMLCGMGLGERLVAISHECDFPPEVLHLPRVTRTNLGADAPSAAIDVEVREKLAAGGALYEIDEARLAALAPELIVTQAQCDVCAVRYDDVLAARDRNPALGQAEVVALNPMTLGDIFSDIRRVGKAAGAEEAAARYVANLAARVAAVRDVAGQIPAAARRQVVLIEWIEPLMLAANWMPELVELAGGEPVLTQAGRHSTYADWNAVRQCDPEVILVSPCGFDLPRSVAESGALAKLPGWADLQAVKQGRVLAVDGNAYFNRSGPRIVESLEILAHLIYPERFPAPATATPQPWCLLNQEPRG